ETLQVRERLSLAAHVQERPRQTVVRFGPVGRRTQDLSVSRDGGFGVAVAKREGSQVALRLRLLGIAGERSLEVLARLVELASLGEHAPQVRPGAGELGIE